MARLALFVALALSAAYARPLFAQADTKAQEKPKKQEKKTETTKAKKAEQTPVPGDTADVPAQRKALSRVLRNFSDAVEGNSPQRLREFLHESFYDFPRFEDQVTAFLKQNAELRMFLRESTSEVKGDKATLIVDADMTYAEKAVPTVERKRRERIQFDFVRTAAGWKIYEITPRRFFTP